MVDEQPSVRWPAPLVEVLERSRSLGLLGPGAVDHHLEHANGFVRALDDLGRGTGRVLDLGAGGGVPGLVVAVACPQVTLTLLDGSERRVAVLRDAIRRLQITDRVSAVVGRAEVVAHLADHRERYDAVIARSFGPPAATAECGAGFLPAGGDLLVSEPGPDAGDRWPTAGLARLGLESVEERVLPTSTIRVLRRVRDGIDTVPRSDGVPVRRPLF